MTLLTPPTPGPVTVEWTWSGTQGTAFVVERCTLQQPGCPMAPVVTLALTVRLWVDAAVQPDDDYCYRLAVQQGASLGRIVIQCAVLKGEQDASAFRVAVSSHATAADVGPHLGANNGRHHRRAGEQWLQ